MSQSLEMHKRAFQVGRLWGGRGRRGVGGRGEGGRGKGGGGRGRGKGEGAGEGGRGKGVRGKWEGGGKKRETKRGWDEIISNFTELGRNCGQWQSVKIFYLTFM